MTEVVKWGNEDIEIYYKFLQTKNPYNYTLCPVFANEGDSFNEFSTFDAIQLKWRDNFTCTQQFIELKGRYFNLDKCDGYALIDLYKVQKLQEYSKANDMKCYIVNIWKYDNNKITIHEVHANKDYEQDCVFYKNINGKTADNPRKTDKKMVKFPIEKVYDWVNL